MLKKNTANAITQTIKGTPTHSEYNENTINEYYN
jgi:hypothetical protein